MPFYTTSEMGVKPGGTNPLIQAHTALGEFIKVGTVTKPEGEGPPLHEHPNEEQWSFILEDQMHYILADEERMD